MTFIRHLPAAPLNALVDVLWWSQRAAAYKVDEHMLPSGRAQLVIALHDEPVAWSLAANPPQWQHWTHAVVHGPQSCYYLAGAKPAGIVMGASIRAGAIQALFGVAADELLDRHISLDAIWGLYSHELRERLATATSPTLALQLFERELRTRMRQPLLLHPAVAYALQRIPPNCVPTQISRIQRETGYSARHFIATFRSSMGLTPKHYSRIQRFSRVLQSLSNGQSSLAQLAAVSGYVDQAHLTHEFGEFAGVSPSKYSPPPGSPHHHLRTPAARNDAGKKSTRPAAR